MKDILGVQFKITNNINEFKEFKGGRLNYSDARQTENEFFIKAHSLLFEMTFYFQDVTFHDFYDFKGLFLTDSDADLPFDPFAASFFLVTRYEELTDKMRDEHDRFLPSHSVANKYDFIEEPIVDQWAYLIKKKLLERFPELVFTPRKFNFISTIDIDQAFAFKNREAFRIIGGLIRSLVKFEFKDFARQIAVYIGSERDPYDTFEYIQHIHKKYKIEPIIFILFGRYGKFDKNIPVNNRAFRELVAYLAQFAEIGLHPSYTSNFDFLQLKQEMKSLASVSNKWIKCSRQHFLKLKLPDTYYNLVKLNVTADHTMGYARSAGFRAGTCTPFRFFDLKRNVAMDIMVYPFQVMDRSLQQYLHLSPAQAIQKIEKIVQHVKKVDGTFICLWHNDSLSNYREYKGWKNVYNKMFEFVFTS